MDIGAGTGIGFERKLDRLDLGRSDHAAGGDGFEGAQELALKALNAISSNLRAGGDQATQYQLLTASIAGLVGARRVLFWQLNPDRTTSNPFIHLIVYDSKLQAQKFYFAWEDTCQTSSANFTDLVASVSSMMLRGSKRRKRTR